ncbi:unnamed protein product [Pseudo-nitzschia multistriata]|uniref:Uncharacterized protein n=1 Tax=Pseudo-nitzschia multistriata TaxID=183589 RepID=A0A448Z7T3_9STRA|nr:unnamed protein product [Pseudo-nitzschia multistriata]
MYGAVRDSDDDERNSLLPRGRNEASQNIKPASYTGLVVNRFLIILLLAGLVGISITLQSFQTQLNVQLSTDEEKIHFLEATVEAQGKIIERFNQSVTNADVVEELNTMEDRWDRERGELFAQLNTTKAEVRVELDKAMTMLDQTVKLAEAQIQEDIKAVKWNITEMAANTNDRFTMENNFMIYQVAGTFTVLSCLISMWHMGSHINKMEQPAIQRKILAILWMCPIYAVSSCLSLVIADYAGYFAILKDFYEAYIIYQFLSFCISAIGGGDREKVVDALSKEVGHLTPPFRFCFCCKKHYENDRAMASAILLQCQGFAMQFVFWKPVISIGQFFCKKYSYYGPFATDAMDWKSLQFWMSIIVNISTFVAFAGLLKFYHAVDTDLAWCRPFAKFLCIKGVVFMTFWQGMALKILAETTDVGSDANTADDWSEKVQNFLICLEMLLFSIAHFYCFPVDEWQPGYKVNYRKAKFGETMALNDFFTDLKIILTSDDSRKKKKRASSKKPSESTIPEEDDESETQDGSVFSGMGSSVDEEEESKNALVQALKSYDDDEDDDELPPTQQNDLVDAERRLGNMLDDMLFSPRSVPEDPSHTSVDDNDVIKTEEISRDEETGHIEEGTSKETTGLLTGASGETLTNNLKPSIFTVISQHQSMEEDTEVEEGIENQENGKEDSGNPKEE